MLVIPAVDIMDGECVQLVGGEPDTAHEYGNPVKVAIEWESKGAEYLHIVDLDAAMGEGDNFGKVVEILANVSIGVQVSGGIRSLDRGFELLGNGADRIILGTAALENPEIVEELVEKSGSERVLVALDVKEGEIAVEGWKKKAGKNVIEMARKFENIGVGGFLFTNVDVEGKMSGLDPEPIRKLAEAVNKPIIAAGGVESIDDVRKARDAGAYALVIGTALYEDKIDIKDAMEVAK